ncbi:TIGR00341 family protein [Corallincola platygyrae]|uniref:TIGR00341 family protein n=1 Tax=Corallincola platygyrae TaxID=1193278 RepID=A0ABW4XJL7_9GAMM
MMCFLLFDLSKQQTVKEELLPLFSEQELTPVAFESRCLPKWPEQARVFLFLNDEQLADVLPFAVESQWQVVVLPHPEASNAMRGIGISGKLSSVVEDGLVLEPNAVDLMFCNGRPVLNAVVVGDVFSLKPGGAVEGFGARIKHLWLSWRRLGHLLPKRYELVTGNGDKINTAAMGITLVEHGKNSVMGRRLLPDSQVNDGMFHAILLAPRSLMEMFRFLIGSMFHRSGKSIPKSIGLIKTSRLEIKSDVGLEFRHDGKELCSKTLEIEAQSRVLQLVPSRDVTVEVAKGDSKEQRKVQHLPTGGAIAELTKRPLQWIAHAATDEFKDLYQALRENASPSSVFLTLMILSTLLATVGLFANSPPVIIGAMILAPLMGPIISLSMALARQDEMLLRGSIYTLFAGLALALLFAVASTWLIPLELSTAEIRARMRPNLLDLAVAVISGIAGAYATARASVAKSMAGVAIAVALVPPLAVTGIGIGWAHPQMMWGAFLLFLTNLSGIVLAAAITFLVLGFAPFQRAKRGLLFSLLAVLAVSVPLAFSFSQMVEQKRLLQQLEGHQVQDIKMTQVRVRLTSPVTVSVLLVSKRPLTQEDFVLSKSEIERVLVQPVVLEATSSLRLE